MSDYYQHADLSQLPLFKASSEDPVIDPPANATSTSRQAAKSIHPFTGGMRERVLNYLRQSGGAIAENVAINLDLRLSTTTARINELAKLNLVVDSGQRARTSSGRRAIVWITTDQKNAVGRG